MGTLITQDTAEDKAFYRRLREKDQTYGGDWLWILEHYDALKEKYPNDWVAAFQERVIDHDRDVHKLKERLRGRFGEDAEFVAVYYISPKGFQVIV